MAYDSHAKVYVSLGLNAHAPDSLPRFAWSLAGDAEPVRRFHQSIWRPGMPTLQLVVTTIALFGASSLVGASLYDAVVLAPNLKSGPVVLEHGRLFMAKATPANLFRILSPATQALLLVAVVVNWPGHERRWPLIGALVALVLCDVITFTYHYPRLRVMFTAPLTVDSARVTVAAQQWTTANLIRVALLIGCWCGTLIGLIRLVQAAHPGSNA